MPVRSPGSPRHVRSRKHGRPGASVNPKPESASLFVCDEQQEKDGTVSNACRDPEGNVSPGTVVGIGQPAVVGMGHSGAGSPTLDSVGTPELVGGASRIVNPPSDALPWGVWIEDGNESAWYTFSEGTQRRPRAHAETVAVNLNASRPRDLAWKAVAKPYPLSDQYEFRARDVKRSL